MRVRLLYLRDTTVMCGPAKTIVNTWRTLNRDRFSLTIASTRPPIGQVNALLERAKSLEAEALPFEISGGVNPREVQRLATLLRDGRFDILQTHDAQTRRLGVLAAPLAGVAHVTSVHGWIFNTRKERVARWLDQRMIRFADHVIAISERLKGEIVAGGTDQNRVTVLRNGILLDDYPAPAGGEQLRRELGIPRQHAVVSIIGRLSLEKGHDVFLAAARILAPSIRDLTFLVVGEGPQRTQLEKLVRCWDLQDRVVFAGHRSDMGPVYDATTIVVSSSFTEGVPNVLLEAFAFGRPVIATRVGGSPEIMANGAEGYLVEAGDVEGLAERLASLLHSPESVRRMGARARQSIEASFDFRARTKGLETLYESVLTRRESKHRT